MRIIEATTQFRRDLKREKNGEHRSTIDDRLTAIVDALAADQPLPARYRGHRLSGRWSGYRDCHIMPDLVLIYRLPDAQTLQLVRLGSHAELSL